MNAADRRRLTPVLVGIAVALALLLIAFWSGFVGAPHWRAHVAPPRLPAAGTTLPPLKVPALGHFATVWQHPLFSPDRTPHAVANAGPADGGDLQLTGVIMLPALEMAIVHDNATGKDYRLPKGLPSNGGPALLELHPRSAVLDVSGSHLQLKLKPGPSPDTGATPAPAAALHSRAAAAARAQALKVRIETERRRARQHDGG